MLDKCVRTVLRRLGGLPEARGNRSVYVNCPLARAWWRERLVAEVATNEGEGLEREIRAVVHPESQQYWEDLVTFVVSRNSVFGSVEVRNILIRTLAKVLDENPRSPLRTADELKRVCRSVSSIQASFELSVVPPEDVKSHDVGHRQDGGTGLGKPDHRRVAPLHTRTSKEPEHIWHNKNAVRYDRRTVSEWVEAAWAGKVAITDFQRSFVWDPGKATEYIKAILMGKPVGLYLILSVVERTAIRTTGIQQHGYAVG